MFQVYSSKKNSTEHLNPAVSDGFQQSSGGKKDDKKNCGGSSPSHSHTPQITSTV